MILPEPDMKDRALPAGRGWGVTVAASLMMTVLGTVYAWSFFQNPMVETYDWHHADVMWVFSLTICVTGLAATVGGRLLHRWGPRRLAITGVILYGTGYLLAGHALVLKSLVRVYLGFGLIGGIGLGFGYVTPVATVAKWFPHRKGMATGMVIMGFGFGALLMSKVIAPVLIHVFDGALPMVFAGAGLVLLALGIPAALGLRNPPLLEVQLAPDPADRRLFWTWRFFRLWMLLFLNTSAGILFIGLQSPMIQDLLKRGGRLRDPAVLAAAGATLIGVSSVFNGIGRLFWGAVSDRLGRAWAFRLIFASQALAVLALVYTSHPWVFGILICYVMLCFGGGFGTIPAYVGEVFGMARMPLLYGGVLTAWSAAGIVGPQMGALLKDRFGPSAPAFTYAGAAALLALGLLFALLRDGRRASSNTNTALTVN